MKKSMNSVKRMRLTGLLFTPFVSGIREREREREANRNVFSLTIRIEWKKTFYPVGE